MNTLNTLIERWWLWSAASASRKLIGFGIPLAVLVIAAAAILGNDQKDEAPRTADAPDATQVAEAVAADIAPTPSGSDSITVSVTPCAPVHPSLEALLERHVTAAGQGDLTNVRAVKSEDYEKVWMVAGVFDYPGFSGEVGVWAVDIEDPTQDPDTQADGVAILSVNAYAKEFSDWFHGDESSFHVRQSDHGVKEAEDCTT